MVNKTSIPGLLTTENIGKVVKVQVFMRKKHDDTIYHDTMDKYVGVLEGYHHNKNSINIKIQGVAYVQTSRHKQLVEVFL